MVKGECNTPPYYLKRNFGTAVGKMLVELLHNEYGSKRSSAAAVGKIPSIRTGLPLVHVACADDRGFVTERCGLGDGSVVVNSNRAMTIHRRRCDDTLCAGL